MLGEEALAFSAVPAPQRNPTNPSGLQSRALGISKREWLGPSAVWQVGGEWWAAAATLLVGQQRGTPRSAGFSEGCILRE